MQAEIMWNWVVRTAFPASLALLCLLPLSSSVARGASAAPDPPVPWGLTGTSSTVHIAAEIPRHRVERRRFEKNGSAIVRSGLAYLSRGDFYSSPGLALEATWYPEETLGVDVLSATLFFSELTSAGDSVRRSTGFLPDSQKPLARLMTGGRFAFAYGKVLVEALDIVVHMDLSASIHLGVLLTDKRASRSGGTTPNLGGDVGVSFQAALVGRMIAWTEIGWLLTYERRTATSFASGPIAVLGLGVLL